MKKFLVFIFLTVVCTSFMLLGSTAQEGDIKVKAQPFVIFGPERSVTISNIACEKDEAKHGVRIIQENGANVIHWRWANKRTSWCGWELQDIPFEDFTQYEERDFKLVIKLKGSWTDNAPQIKFLDKGNKSTKLLRISSYIKGDLYSKEGALVIIPLKRFDLSWSIDIQNVKGIQFDAAYESTNGDIKIYEIKVIM